MDEKYSAICCPNCGIALQDTISQLMEYTRQLEQRVSQLEMMRVDAAHDGTDQAGSINHSLEFGSKIEPPPISSPKSGCFLAPTLHVVTTRADENRLSPFCPPLKSPKSSAADDDTSEPNTPVEAVHNRRRSTMYAVIPTETGRRPSFGVCGAISPRSDEGISSGSGSLRRQRPPAASSVTFSSLPGPDVDDQGMNVPDSSWNHPGTAESFVVAVSPPENFTQTQLPTLVSPAAAPEVAGPAVNEEVWTVVSEKEVEDKGTQTRVVISASSGTQVMDVVSASGSPQLSHIVLTTKGVVPPVPPRQARHYPADLQHYVRATTDPLSHLVPADGAGSTTYEKRRGNKISSISSRK